MSSLTRARSLRKPTSTAPDLPPKERQQEPARNVSPSRLPMRPTASTATTSSGAAPKPRPTSMMKPSKPAAPAASAPLRRSTSLKQKSTTQEAPPKKEQSRYPPSTTFTRPQAATRPTSAGSTSSSANRRTPSSTHTRANSTATATTSQPQRKSRSRPPSREQPPPAARTPHRRAVSVEKPQPSTPSPNTPSAFQPQPRLRPAFNNLQQHYSPAKTQSPKPQTSSYTGPPSPSKFPANIAISAETSRLQAELLQLHILHRDAGHVESQWHASAKEKLGERFRQVCDASKELVRLEAADVEIDNAAAIRKWGAERGSSLEEKIQALDAAVNGVWAMGEPGGRYARLVRRFERWVDGVLELEEARKGDGEALLSGGYDSPFIDDLDATWSDECAGMARKLGSWQSHLEEVGDVPDGDEPSSLERVVNGSRSLVEDMLAELEAMEEIRQAALAREDEWIDRVNRDGDEDDTRRAGAVWRGM